MPAVFRSQRNQSPFWRIVISLVGLALIIIAVLQLALFLFGETAEAQVNVRRYGGADNGRPPNRRYNWSLDYTFHDRNGDIHNGTTTRQGSDMSVDTDSLVYYFPSAPFVSALESDARPNLLQPVYIIIGAFLIFAMNKKRIKGQMKDNEAQYSSDQ